MKRLVAVIAIALTVVGCSLEVNDPNPGDPNPSDPATETFAPGLKIDVSTMTRSPNGAFYKDVSVGAGSQLTPNTDVAIVSYRGLLKDGTVFVEIGDQTVVIDNLVGGLRDALPGMRIGGERIIVIPSALGFGSVAVGFVPRNSTLIYDVLLKQLP